MNEQVWKEILENARWAPSAYNAQPWRFDIADETVTLLSRPERRRPVIDPKNRETLISLGSLVYSLRLSAQAAGYALEETWLLSSPFDREVARFTLVKQEPSRQEELEALRAVRTWRREYRHEPISQDRVESLGSLVGTFGALVAKGSSEFKRVVDASVEAAVVHAKSKEIYAELAPYLYHPKRNGHHTWGVVSPVAERQGIREFFWNRLSSGCTALRKGYRASTITDSRDLLHQAPALVLLRGNPENPYELIEVGIRYQQLRLAAYRLGLATQPLSILPQIAAAKSINLEEELQDIQLLIRLGVPMDPKKAPRSVREPVESIIRGADVPDGDVTRAA